MQLRKQEDTSGTKILPFGCPVCGKQFATSAGLGMHSRSHADTQKQTTVFHPVDSKQNCKSRPFVCSVCGRRFFQSSNLGAHLKRHEATKIHKCEMCDKCFSLKSAYVRHLRLHLDNVADCNTNFDKKLKCSINKHVDSDKPLRSKTDVNSSCETQLKVETDVNSSCDNQLKLETVNSGCDEGMKCGTDVNSGSDKQLKFESNITTGCDKGLKYESGDNSGGDNWLICEHCDRAFANSASYKLHQKIHVGNRVSCPRCGKSFKESQYLSVHMRIHTGEKPHTCTICDKSFSQLGNYLTHVRTHSGEKPFFCDVCHKTFSSAGNRDSHRRIHTGEKPFMCDICGLSFARPNSLKMHRNLHTGERPYRCDVCDKAFVSSGKLVDHKRTHSGEKPYTCEVCGLSFAIVNTFKRHKRIHSGHKPHACVHCDRRFFRLEGLRSHLKTHTGQQKKSSQDVPDTGTISVQSVSVSHSQNKDAESTNWAGHSSVEPHNLGYCTSNREPDVFGARDATSYKEPDKFLLDSIVYREANNGSVESMVHSEHSGVMDSVVYREANNGSVESMVHSEHSGVMDTCRSVSETRIDNSTRYREPLQVVETTAYKEPSKVVEDSTGYNYSTRQLIPLSYGPQYFNNSHLYGVCSYENTKLPSTEDNSGELVDKYDTRVIAGFNPKTGSDISATSGLCRGEHENIASPSTPGTSVDKEIIFESRIVNKSLLPIMYASSATATLNESCRAEATSTQNGRTCHGYFYNLPDTNNHYEPNTRNFTSAFLNLAKPLQPSVSTSLSQFTFNSDSHLDEDISHLSGHMLRPDTDYFNVKTLQLDSNFSGHRQTVDKYYNNLVTVCQTGHASPLVNNICAGSVSNNSGSPANACTCCSDVPSMQSIWSKDVSLDVMGVGNLKSDSSQTKDVCCNLGSISTETNTSREIVSDVSNSRNNVSSNGTTTSNRGRDEISVCSWHVSHNDTISGDRCTSCNDTTNSNGSDSVDRFERHHIAHFSQDESSLELRKTNHHPDGTSSSTYHTLGTSDIKCHVHGSCKSNHCDSCNDINNKITWCNSMSESTKQDCVTQNDNCMLDKQYIDTHEKQYFDKTNKQYADKKYVSSDDKPHANANDKLYFGVNDKKYVCINDKQLSKRDGQCIEMNEKQHDIMDSNDNSNGGQYACVDEERSSIVDAERCIHYDGKYPEVDDAGDDEYENVSPHSLSSSEYNNVEKPVSSQYKNIPNRIKDGRLRFSNTPNLSVTKTSQGTSVVENSIVSSGRGPGHGDNRCSRKKSKRRYSFSLSRNSSTNISAELMVGAGSNISEIMNTDNDDQTLKKRNTTKVSSRNSERVISYGDVNISSVSSVNCVERCGNSSFPACLQDNTQNSDRTQCIDCNTFEAGSEMSGCPASSHVHMRSSEASHSLDSNTAASGSIVSPRFSCPNTTKELTPEGKYPIKHNTSVPDQDCDVHDLSPNTDNKMPDITNGILALSTNTENKLPHVTSNDLVLYTDTDNKLPHIKSSFSVNIDSRMSSHGKTGAKCSVCKLVFVHWSDLDEHIRQNPHHLIKCHVCGKEFSDHQYLKLHARIHNDDRPYRCDDCGKRFTQSGNYITHLRIHSGDRPYLCSICKKGFTSSGNRDSHQRTHTGVQLYMCDICGKRFSRPSSLKTHRRTHTGERPYRCDICDKGFVSSGKLGDHRRVHTGEKPYTCEVCGLSFAIVNTFRRHKKIHSGERPHKCIVCSKSFVRLEGLKSHLKTHSKDKQQDPLLTTVSPFNEDLSSRLKTHSKDKQYPLLTPTVLPFSENHDDHLLQANNSEHAKPIGFLQQSDGSRNVADLTTVSKTLIDGFTSVSMPEFSHAHMVFDSVLNVTQAAHDHSNRLSRDTAELEKRNLCFYSENVGSVMGTFVYPQAQD